MTNIVLGALVMLWTTMIYSLFHNEREDAGMGLIWGGIIGLIIGILSTHI